MSIGKLWPVGLLLASACAAESARLEKPTPFPLDVEIADSTLLGTAFDTFPSPTLVSSLGPAPLSLPYLQFEPPFGYMCGIVVRQPVPEGSWILTGVSTSSHYRPILDIVALHDANALRNNTVYYHFRLNDRSPLR